MTNLNQINHQLLIAVRGRYLTRRSYASLNFAEQEKSYNMVNAYVQNRQQPRLEVFTEIAKILDVDVKELIVSTKPRKHD